MIELTIKDADEIIKYLRMKLSVLVIKKKSMVEASNLYNNKDNQDINNLVDIAIPLEDREDFGNFMKDSINEVEREEMELQNYIYLLTVGSENK